MRDEEWPAGVITTACAGSAYERVVSVTALTEASSPRSAQSLVSSPRARIRDQRKSDNVRAKIATSTPLIYVNYSVLVEGLVRVALSIQRIYNG